MRFLTKCWLYYSQQPRLKEVRMTLKTSGFLGAVEVFKDCAVESVNFY